MQTLNDRNMTRQQTSSLASFTLLETVLILCVLTVALGFLLPAMAKAKAKSSRIGCINCIKQIGLGFRMYANDNGDKFPWEPQTNATALSLLPPKILEPCQYFQMLSNELVNPKILICPNDTNRRPAREFSTLANSNVSYFIGLDSKEGAASLWLTGDRVLTRDRQQLPTGLNVLGTNDAIGWADEPHHGDGNIGFADGSAMQIGRKSVNKSFQENGLPVARLLIP